MAPNKNVWRYRRIMGLYHRKPGGARQLDGSVALPFGTSSGFKHVRSVWNRAMFRLTARSAYSIAAALW